MINNSIVIIHLIGNDVIYNLAVLLSRKLKGKDTKNNIIFYMELLNPLYSNTRKIIIEKHDIYAIFLLIYSHWNLEA